jgi:N-methylhydantoinase B/oxoprolinase/acetone carboxylase alpha subunit
MAVDPISLEVFKNMFISVAEEMGVAPLRTAYSPNIKERRDFSCAISIPRDRLWPRRPTCRCTWERCPLR